MKKYIFAGPVQINDQLNIILMRKPLIQHAFIFLIIFFSVRVFITDAQRPQSVNSKVEITGWEDDTHYLIRTYDKEGKAIYQSVNIKNGKGETISPVLSPEELLIRSLPDGIDVSMSKVYSPDMKRLVIIIENDLYFFSVGDKELKRLTNDNTPEVNVRFSPDGNKLAYTKIKDLYIYDLTAGIETRLSYDASEKIYNGYSSWVYMEEILGRGSQYAAFWWSPDGNKIAYLRTDETDVPVFTLNRLDEPDGIHGLIEATPYPKPGDPNPKVKMGIVDVASLKTVWLKTDYSIDQYLAWPFWTPDSKKLAVQVVNRDQNKIKIILADPSNGDFSEIYEESRKSWIDFYEDIYVMKDGSGFILRSYRSDWENLYYYGWNGNRKAQLTNFKFRVTGIDRVDEDRKVVYFSATGDESTNSHAFRVGIDGTHLVQLTNGDGTHKVTVSPKGTYFIDTWNSVENAGSIISYNENGIRIREIYNFNKQDSRPSVTPKVEMVKIMTSDSLFNMPAIITYPLHFDPSGKYPVVFTIYGGPDSKNVTNRWQGDTPSWYAENGIITFMVDHRGSGQFGKKGLDFLYRSLGKWEILDYEDAVKWLRTKSFVDEKKVGITGSSYGGYMTCMALTKGAGYWTHGFAGSSVTDWRLYDDIYTERYMDKPQDNPEGYKEGSSLTYVKEYKGKLYLTHGDVDDNVHMQNSIYLISRLQDEGKIFEFMLYPGERHGLRGAKVIHYRNEAYNFWLKSFYRE